MRYKDLFENSLKRLKTNQNPLDIQILIQESFSISKERFWMNRDENISSKAGLQKFYRYFKRLMNGEPVQYIIKRTEFFSIPLHVKKGVLVPRPETELLVEQALLIIEAGFSVLDIGAGSGAISVALAKNTNCNVTALEKSEAAIGVLKKNIRDHHLEERVKIVKGDLFPESQRETFDMIVSNPPYITEKDWKGLDDNVKLFEPKMALVGGEMGTEIIMKIITGSKKYLKTGGSLLVEIGYDQGMSVPAIFKENGFRDVMVIPDYSGIGRIVTGRR